MNITEESMVRTEESMDITKESMVRSRTDESLMNISILIKIVDVNCIMFRI